MFERYTDDARRALFFARYEVSAIGGEKIEPAHILLGLLRSTRGLVHDLFKQADLTYKDVRLKIESRSAGSAKRAASVEIPFDARTTKVLEYAAEEADRLAHSYIGTEHLLLGLLREEGPGDESPTQSRGLHFAQVRDEIVRMLREEGNVQGTPASGQSTEFAGMPGAVSPEVFHAYLARRVVDGVARIEQLLVQLGSEVEGNPRALEILEAIETELQSLKLP